MNTPTLTRATSGMLDNLQGGPQAAQHASQHPCGDQQQQTAPAARSAAQSREVQPAKHQQNQFWRDEPGEPKKVWNAPRPLRTISKPEPYPVDALPSIIRDVIEEVAEFTQAPIAMIAASALTAVSVVVQGHASVRRAANLQGPASLYFLTIAPSGERKTTCDNYFTSAIREWETQQVERYKPAQTSYRAAIQAWEEIGKGIKETVRKAGQNGARLDSITNPLIQHELQKPIPPRVPSMLRQDDTPEAIGIALDQWPIAAVVSSEAGIIFGAHGMNPDSVTRNLSQANVFWEGGHLKRDRASSRGIDINDMRVTMGLQVQPQVLDNFMSKTGSLARGIGYFARFLFSQPESTQGSRFFREPKAGGPALATFNARVLELLNSDAKVNEEGRLLTTYLELDPAAKTAWINFHDAIEEELGVEREFYEVQDVASKAGDNAARIACCLEVFSSGGGSVGVANMRNAIKLMYWYMDEALRFSKSAGIPPALQDAELLERWLANYCNEKKVGHIPVGTILGLGPGPLRKKAARDDALEILEAHDRVKVIKAGKAISVYLNPQVVKEWR